ncbi:class I SAM-dependent methyltransferase [Nonomuraea muscovyensis]|nr:class I SAM-dependent methyltransferase [Nonomuraea muscovyensis]
MEQYERSAEFVDILLASYWPELGPQVARALDGVPGPVVDVGAGGGHGTRVIAAAVPHSEILAVEPSPALRSVLMARVHEAAELRERVTVLPEGFLQARLPARLGAVVAMNVIGHFDPEERGAVWDLLADRLVPGGRAVVNLQPPTEPVAVPQFRSGEARIGRRTYEGLARAEPAGPEQLTWHLTYRTHQDGELVDEVAVSHVWWLLSEERMTKELGERGLTPKAAGSGMYVIS